jgi:hypothetical protein
VGPTAPTCTRDSDCNDAIDCTIDTCVAERCDNEPDDSRCPVSHACEPGLGCEARAWALARKRNGSGLVLWDIRLPSGRGKENAIEIDSFNYPTDIALSPSGELIGVEWESFYSIAEKGGVWSAEATALTGLNSISALDFSAAGDLYAGAANRLYRYDAALGGAAEVAIYPGAFRSSGDLAVLQDRILATAHVQGQTGNSLVEFDLGTASSHVVGPIGYTCVHGLAAFGGAALDVDGGQELEVVGHGSSFGRRLRPLCHGPTPRSARTPATPPDPGRRRGAAAPAPGRSGRRRVGRATRAAEGLREGEPDRANAHRTKE